MVAVKEQQADYKANSVKGVCCNSALVLFKAVPSKSLVLFLQKPNSFICISIGKIQALLAATKEQRREYKAKFVDMDVEFARMRERLETMNLILDDIQVL